VSSPPNAASRLSALSALPHEELGRDLPAGRVLVVRAREQVGALLEAELAIRAGSADGVHDARVACRRLAAALAMFRPLLRTEVSEPLRDELRWLARSLGTARDDDVTRERLLDLARTRVDKDVDAGPLIEQLQSEDWSTAAEGRPGTSVLDTGRYDGLLATLEAFVTDPPWRPMVHEDAGPFLRRRVGKEWHRLVSVVSVVTDAPPGTSTDEQLHDARKAVKRMRYALETAELLWPRKPKALRKHVRDLTDVLGEHQDTVMARSALSHLVEQAESVGSPTFVHGHLHEMEHHRAVELEARFRNEWAATVEVRRDWP